MADETGERRIARRGKMADETGERRIAARWEMEDEIGERRVVGRVKMAEKNWGMAYCRTCEDGRRDCGKAYSGCAIFAFLVYECMNLYNQTTLVEPLQHDSVTMRQILHQSDHTMDRMDNICPHNQ